jgi:23S rRNA (cytidine1920-2'-O)/16S rRNA (cytidine1409-2'-O)-methyltransferase
MVAPSIVAKPGKVPLDKLLVERGLAESLTRARSLIMSGKVFSSEVRLDKPGQVHSPGMEIVLRSPDHPWVSRGGVKLARALEEFSVDPKGCVCLDVGVSTGGFTHVLLKQGASKVYAVDVGRGQLAWELRSDPRVEVLERTNARYLTQDQIPDVLDVIVCDASFISLETILLAPLSLVAPGAVLVALIKPQFEVGRDHVGKGGIVTDPTLHEEVCARISAWLSELPGWTVLGLCDSPIKGAGGNKEFLIAARHKG